MVNKLKMPDDGFVMVESHRIIERLYNVFQMPSISSRSWFSIKNSSDKLWQWINQGTRWRFDHPSVVCIHGVVYKVEMIYIYILILSDNEIFQCDLMCPKSPKNHSYRAYTRKVIVYLSWWQQVGSEWQVETIDLSFSNILWLEHWKCLPKAMSQEQSASWSCTEAWMIKKTVTTSGAWM